MPTQIIDGFKLNANTPIDSRMVTSGTVSRNNLAYKYDGLRVFDIVQKMPFVYIDGQWKQELEQSSQAAGGGGAISGTGKKNYLTKFDTNGLTNSVVREATGGANTFVGINIPINSPIQNQLHVGGVVQASSFCGNILGTFVNVGTLPLNRLCTPAVAGNYILKYQNGSAVWGSMDSTATATTIQNDTNSSLAFVTFASGINGAQSLNVSCSNANEAMTANLLTSQLLMSNTNGQSTPPYSFIGAGDTGLYGNVGEIGISMTGNKRISVTSNKLEISTGGNVNIEAGTNYVQVYKNSTFTGTVNISGITTVSNKLIATNFQMTTLPGEGKLLISDSVGNASWGSAVSLGVPVGTIIMFLLNNGGASEWSNLPVGWKPCTNYSNANGTAPGPSHKGQVYVNGQYIDIPDMRNRVLMGSDDMKTFGTYGYESPSAQQTVTLNWQNMAPHKHQVSTSNYTNQANCGDSSGNYTLPTGFGKCKVEASSTFTGSAEAHSHGVQSRGLDWYNGGTSYHTTQNSQGVNSNTAQATLTPKGSVSTTINGWTDDGSAWLGGYQNMGKPFNIPMEKKQAVLFIIKIDPNAVANTVGHFRIIVA